MKKTVIALTGGGSGGHIVPLLSLAREVKKQTPDSQIVYIGLKGETLDRFQDEYAVFDLVYYVPAGKFRRYHGESLLSHIRDIKTLLLNMRDFFRVLVGTFVAYKVLKRCKPDVLFSKGSFVAVPVGIAAKLQGVPIVTHDSDTVPGLANRIIGRWATVHTTGMPGKYYKYKKETTRYVGVPVDSRIEPVNSSLQAEYKGRIGLEPEQKLVVISGGGHGAQSLNKTVVSMVPELLKNHVETVVVHFTGEKNFEEIQKDYKKNLPASEENRVKIIGFSPDLYLYSGAADVIISRAGATTLAELAVQGKACIIVPSPFLAGGHQLKNAHYLKEVGAVEVLPNNATPKELLKKTQELLTDDNKRTELITKLSGVAKRNASHQIAAILIETAVKKDVQKK